MGSPAFLHETNTIHGSHTPSHWPFFRVLGRFTVAERQHATTMGGHLIFEWNEQKRRDNYRKHRLDFADAASFFGGLVLAAPDDRFDYGEPRMRAVGMLGERVVVVIYTEAEDAIRIISMRKASRHEEAHYFQSLQN